MRDVQKLRELLERCEKASGPDPLLDSSISDCFKITREKGVLDYFILSPGFWDESQHKPKPFTASLDASIALVERMLPGWGNTVGRSPDGIAQASVFDPDRRKPPFSYSQDRADGSRPLALLTAALRALISQAEGETQHG